MHEALIADLVAIDRLIRSAQRFERLETIFAIAEMAPEGKMNNHEQRAAELAELFDNYPERPSCEDS